MARTVLLRSTLALALCLATQALGERKSQGNGEGECKKTRRETAFDADIRAAIHEVARVWPVPPSFVRAVIRQESDFNPSALSPAGAVGLMQVLPSNAQRLGFSPEALWRPADNILAGVRLLAVLLRHYQGDVISALVAYNGRPRPRLAPLPDNSETPRYVRAVLHFWANFDRCETRSTLPIKPTVHAARLFGYRHAAQA
jgi:soluble lytic murein transglycosylase-like protein